MDYDVSNMQMLSAGAFYQSSAKAGGDWQPMSSAPHDGTIIEVRCTYGVAPWYNLFRWQTHFVSVAHRSDGTILTIEYDDPRGRWAKVGQENSSFTDGATFSWRPYSGNAQSYVDPTGGAQNSPAYWRGAVAAKYGLPLNHFEKETEANIANAPTVEPPLSIWGWLFSLIGFRAP